MALETFAPDQWAQNLTTGHYQAMLNAGWPDDAVQQCANTLFNFTLLCGQLLMQEQVLALPVNNPDDPPQTIELTEDIAGQILDYFSETITHALQQTLQLGLPADVRQRVIETLAEDVFSYCKQMAASVITADPAPPREELSQWLAQTAQDALQHYLGEYEKDFGPISQSPVLNTTPEPATPAAFVDEPEEEAPLPGAMAEIPESPALADAMDDQTDGPAATSPSPAPAQTTPPPQALKLGAIALLLKTLPPSAHGRVLQLFPTNLHADIQAMAASDDWMEQLDPVALNQQLQGLKQALQQPADHPTTPLAQLVQRLPWPKVLDAIKHERPIWVEVLTALKQHDIPERPIPAFMQQEMLAHLRRQLDRPLQPAHDVAKRDNANSGYHDPSPHADEVA
jgi:hypothetical protein